MNKIILFPIALSLAACNGTNNDSRPSPESDQVKAAERPSPLKVEPKHKESFVRECESADPNSDLGILYKLMDIGGKSPECAGKFNHIARTRRANLRAGFTEPIRLTALTHIPFVEEINITGPVGGKIDSLSSLKNLQNLVLTDSDVEDLAPLKDARYLRSLVISGTPIKDVTPLVPLKNLRTFILSETLDVDKKPILPKDEKHCPVKSENRAVTIACKEYRGIK